MTSTVGLLGVTVAAVAVEHTLVVVRSAAQRIENMREEDSSIFHFSEYAQQLQQKLKRLELYLQDADRASQSEEPEPIKQWIRDLAAAALDSRDIVALCTIPNQERLRDCLFPGSSFVRCSSSCFASPVRNLISMCARYLEIININSTLNDLEGRATALKLQKEPTIQQPGPSTSTPADPPPDSWRTASLVFDQDNLFDEGAWDSTVDEILNMLSSNTAVAVVGTLGSGKTRLLEHVSNSMPHLKRIWICHSETYTVKRLQVDILKILGVNYPKILGVNKYISINWSLQKFIYKFFKHRPYLLVLDNVCNLSRNGRSDSPGMFGMDMLREVGLPIRNDCKVLLSTRSYDVASAFGASIYSMPLLSPRKSERLFLKHLFPHCHIQGRLPTPDQQELISEVLHKCGGLPLALISIAGILKHKNPQHWQSTLEHWSSSTSSSGIEIERQGDNHIEQLSSSLSDTDFNPEAALLTAIGLSFNSLEYQVKACFGLLGIFAEDEKIYSEKLIGMWKAEELVSSHQEGLAMLMYLSNRGLVQLLQTEEFHGGRYIVKVPGIQHALAVSIFVERGGQGDIFDSSEDEWEAISRFALSKASAAHSRRKLKMKDMERIFFSYHKVAYIPSTFKCPRSVCALRLNRNWALEKIPGKVLGNATSLRTLDLSNTRLDEFPDSVNKLKFLKFLDISENSISVLPQGLQYLKLLEYLYVPKIAKVPFWIAELQQLTHFCAQEDCVENTTPVYFHEFGKKMECIEVVRNIPIPVGWQPLKNHTEFWSWSDISKVSQLREATLVIYKFPGNFTPPSGLNTLSLMLKPFSSPITMPNEWPMVDRLESLHLRNIDLPREVSGFQRLRTLFLDIHGAFPVGIVALPELRCLKLRNRHLTLLRAGAFSEELPQGYGDAGAFPKLHTLVLTHLTSLLRLPRIEEGCMPFLKVLKIERCPKLNETPGWKEKVCTLERLVISSSNKSLAELVNSFRDSTKRGIKYTTIDEETQRMIGSSSRTPSSPKENLGGSYMKYYKELQSFCI